MRSRDNLVATAVQSTSPAMGAAGKMAPTSTSTTPGNVVTASMAATETAQAQTGEMAPASPAADMAMAKEGGMMMPGAMPKGNQADIFLPCTIM
ncbi:hypothetical protein H9P43_006688 [Blastocladiella emersonii ATCC 22665]|nr:hypothetical protein H9P43_006688 [Blastocladiella emersonii ATCC 22665]